jgi:hypothetical protein
MNSKKTVTDMAVVTVFRGISSRLITTSKVKICYRLANGGLRRSFGVPNGKNAYERRHQNQPCEKDLHHTQILSAGVADTLN